MGHMDVIFRADASLDIGTGHVMRCLTLADELRNRGANCRFVCREHIGNLIALIQQRGYETHSLPSTMDRGAIDDEQDERLPAHASWLGVDWLTDAQQTQAVLGVTPVDWIIVDHYALDTKWEHELRPACHHLMVIDDLADRPHDCNLLLDQNLGRTAADYDDLVPTDCSILLGPLYALLRSEFAVLRSYSLARRVSPKLKNMLISMGGVDKDNATVQVLDALQGCSLPNDCHITVVMGPHAPWLAQVREQARQLPWDTDVQVDVQNMAKLMADSDIAIGAAGSTSWERCTLGLPTLMLVLAENQREAALALAGRGAVVKLTLAMIASELTPFLKQLSDSNALTNLSDRSAGICDGLGAPRVAEVILA